MPGENQELRNAGLKVTLPRVKILQILEQGNPHHMSAEDVYKSLLESGDDVGLATVYRVLTQFHDAGLVQRHNFDSGHSVFELVRGDHHDHILCIDCGRVAEFHDEIIEQRQQQIAQDMGYELKDHSLHLYAHCRKAQCPYLPATASTVMTDQMTDQ
jgi:Fur family transcriptional regulator, ferric uptake regulator